jgi:glycosyltransferase involved in cell wall biosynthesis
MSPVRVVHLITSLESGGAQAMLHRLVARIDRGRFASVVVTLVDGGAVAERIRAEGVPVHGLGMRPGAPSPAGAARLVRLLRRERPAIVQTWLYHADLLGLLAARVAGAPPVLWNVRSSNMETARYGRSTALTIRLCARLSAWPQAVLVNSEAGRAFHARLGYRPREWVSLPNGIDTARFRPDEGARAAIRAELGLAPDAPLIGLLARFDPMKDHGTFFRAAGLLARRRPDARFLLAGKGIDRDNPALARLAGEAGVADATLLLGERPETARLTAALDLATSSSAYGEGFSNTLGEAMACAVPCVATDVGDAALIVGDTGRIVPPGDPAALAGAWEGLLGLAPGGRRALGDRARARIEARYALGPIVRRYEEVYARALPAG